MGNIEVINEMFNIDNEREIFKKIIEYIRFPYFKNFEENLRINFTFPIVFITGSNGAGKSSLLQALYGAPQGKSISEFWFNTELDPIKELSENRHCFIYSYKTEYSKRDVEVIKTRIKKTGKDDKNKPDYWEPSRPLKKFQMEAPREDSDYRETSGSKDRWNLLTKNVYYMDFRYSLSAYDKYFYFGSKPNTKTLATKQDLIRKYAPFLKQAFDENKSVSYYSKKTDTPIILSKEVIKEASIILGKEYKKSKILEHDFYEKDNRGFAIMYETDRLTYSEAYAGSGEIAVIKLVNEILAVDEYSLILLDEPETSLHPAAQKRLIEFLLNQIKNKKLQVVVSTHSPDIIYNMPKETIKILYENQITGKVNILENIMPENAFLHLGHSNISKKTIIVEDNLAKTIVEKVIEKTGNNGLFEVKFFPGGESRIKQENMVVYSKEEDKNHFILFDGDQKKDKKNLEDILQIDMTGDKLKKIIYEIVGEDIKFATDGGNMKEDKKEEQKIELMKKYIEYHKNNVFYLPQNTPEEIIWDIEVVKNTDLSDEEKTAIISEDTIKKRFNLFAKYNFGDTSSIYQNMTYEYFIVRWLKNDKNSDFINIAKIIECIKEM